MKKLKNLKTQKHLKGANTMKKAISTVLVAAMLASGAGNAFAVAPTDIEDPKCIDTGNLNEKRWVSFPKKPGQKVCGCKTCEVDVMTFDKIPEYLDKVQQELKELDQDIRTNKNKTSIEKMEDFNKAVNISSILSYMKTGIEFQNYLRGNVYLATMNNAYNDIDSFGRFERHEGITYDTEYDEKYFSSLISQIDKILKNRDREDEKNTTAIKKMEPITDALQRKQENKMIVLAATGALVFIGALAGLMYYVEHLRQEGQISNRAVLYIWEKFFGPLEDNQTVENLGK